MRYDQRREAEADELEELRRQSSGRVTVSTTGKVSKKKGVASVAAVIEGLPEGPVTVTKTVRPNLPSPNSAAMMALWLGVGFAVAHGATELEVFSSSKNAVKATDGTGGADYATRLDAHLTGYVIHWTRQLATAGGSWAISYKAAKEMPEAVEAASGALEALGQPEPAQGSLFV